MGSRSPDVHVSPKSRLIAFVGLCGAAYGIDSFLQVIHLTGS